MILLHYVCYICNKCIGTCQLFFRVLYVGPGARLAVKSRGSGCSTVETPRFKLFRLYIKWSLSLKHVVLEGVM